MLQDLNERSESSLECDLCIVGAGAAGIALALSLKDSPLRVVVLESGGMARRTDTDALNTFTSGALPIDERCRARVFGGTTTLWTGGWKQLDAEDFASHDWLPLSGWPIAHKELEPYYERAAQLFDAPLQPKKIAHDVERSGALSVTRLDVLPERMWNFGAHFRNEIEHSPVQFLINASVTSIEVAEGRVRSLAIRSLEGKSAVVHPRCVVLACGGIENPRLLLASNIGNEHDQVGRYYIDHPKGSVGDIKTDAPEALVGLLEHKEGGRKVVPGIQLSSEHRLRERTTNCYVQLRPVYAKRGLIVRLLEKFRLIQPRLEKISLRSFMEQTPSPDNRITLSSKRDAFGTPLPRIDWTISREDKRGMRLLHKALAEELQSLGLGRLESPILSGDEWPIAKDASHHMGTTRMGIDPSSSVVDADCRVHSVENLYVAGSSVFPTGGHANPNATILALAIRLADHLKTRIRTLE